MTKIKTIALLMTFLGALPLHAAEPSKPELAALFAPFQELHEEPQLHYVALAFERASLPVEAREERPAASDRAVRLLLRKLKRDPYRGGLTSEGIRIAGRGAKALPPVLEELEGAEDYYRNCLLDILSAIPDPRRDAAFVAQLESLLTEKKGFLTNDTAEPLMRTAGSQGIQEAIPVLRRFLTAEGFRPETRAEACLALAQLGALDIAAQQEVPYETGVGLDTEELRSQVELLQILLKYELVKSPLRLVEFEAGDGPTKILKGTIEGGTWYLRVGREQGGRVPFYYNWYTGPLSAAGCMGVAEKQNGQWMVTYWRMMWIS